MIADNIISKFLTAFAHICVEIELRPEHLQVTKYPLLNTRNRPPSHYLLFAKSNHRIVVEELILNNYSGQFIQDKNSIEETLLI